MREIVTISDLLQYLSTGQQPVVTFKKHIEEKEAYAEVGMRARILRAHIGQHDCVEITFDFAEFDAFNLPFETSAFFDKDGKPTQTARQAGYYKPQEALYYDIEALMENELEIVDAQGLALYTEYQTTENKPTTYVAWLEQLVLASRKD